MKTKENMKKSVKNNAKNRVNSIFYKSNPSGISLIVLVITIIVIIILAAAVILTLNNNNPINEANQARYESDVANIQAVFTNTVAKVMAQNQSTIEINAGSLNSVQTVENGVNSAEGSVNYTLNNPQDSSNENGTIIFNTGTNNATTYYTGRKLPLYSSGKTVWYVDSEGVISLKINDKEYGNGNKTDKPAGEVKEEIEITASDNPMLQSWSSSSATDFHNAEYREKITKIKFSITNKVPKNRVEAWDVSSIKDKSVMAWVEDDGAEGYILTIAGKEKIVANSRSVFLFNNFTELKEIENIGILDISNVTTMSNMFARCENLINLDLSSWDTSNVIAMDSMFINCSSLTNLDLSSFDTSNVNNIGYMFSGCNKLESLILGNKFNTMNVDSYTYMFRDCYKLTTTLTISHKVGLTSQNVNSAFENVATIPPAKVILNYNSNTESWVDNIINANKNSNIVKGTLIE